MELLELMKYRRSVRKYQSRQISREDMEAIIEAGTCAPNAGGGQRSIVVGVRNAELAEKIGRLNVARFDRTRLSGSYVSAEHPGKLYCPLLCPLGLLRWRISEGQASQGKQGQNR